MFVPFSLDGTVERGCRSKDFECPETATCKKCQGLGCNYEGRMFGHCLRCFGDYNSTCATLDGPAEEDHVQLCPISFDKPLCYTFYDGRRRTIERGCTVESIYSEGYLNRCAKEEETTCYACDSNYCNYFTRN